MPENNPIVEVYNGIPIRKSNIFKIRINPVAYKALLIESETTGLPISKILVFSSIPCQRCSAEPVQVFIDGEGVKVKRGILSLNTSQNSSTSIIKQKNAKGK
jgi:hypothetical protein